jgi:hypothetical protein
MPPKARASSQGFKGTPLQSKRKQKEETPSEPTPKRPKKNASATKEKSDAIPLSKPITPTKNVINLHDAVMKVNPDTYINPTARKLFGEVTVRSPVIQD